MKKQDALKLENEIDEILSERIENDCEVSMALTGAMRVSVSNYGFFNIKTDTEVVEWVKWSGDYAYLQDCINKAKIAIRENKDKISELMQSYYNRAFLIESEEQK